MRLGDWLMLIFMVSVVVQGFAVWKYIDSLHAWIKALRAQVQSLSRSQDLNDEQFRQVFRALSPDWKQKPKGKEWRS